MKLSWRNSHGRAVLRGEAELLSDARAAFEGTLAQPHICERRPLGDGQVWIKSTAVPPRARLRLGLRKVSSGTLPYEREARNLRWLRAHGFGAPRPLAAGGLWRAGLPLHQVLLTEAILDAVPLDEFLAQPNSAAADRFEALGREVARMHTARFVHRDLFPRNILVSESGFVFLDTRRGGRPLPGRAPTYDLACFLSDACVSPEHGRALLTGYGTVRPVPAGLRMPPDDAGH